MTRRRRHTPEQIVRKLREADRLLNEGADVAAVARHPSSATGAPSTIPTGPTPPSTGSHPPITQSNGGKPKNRGQQQ